MFICTKENPWNSELDVGYVRHDAAHEVGKQEDGYPGGDIVTMQCTNCGHRWRTELPQ